MASTYLTGTDPTAFGIPNATAAQVQAASGVVDAFLKRPAGCVYDPVGSVMLSTGAPIVETPHGRRIMMSYAPVASVLAIKWWQAGTWQNVPWSFGVDAEGMIYVEPSGTEWGWWHGAYRKLQVSYLAGWTYTTLPFAIKQATANVLLAQQEIQSPAFAMAKSGDTQYTRASKSLLDDDTKAMLAPYQRMFAW